MAAGGAPVPPSQVAKMRKKTGGANSVQGYGLTETMGGVTINRGVDYLKRPTSCGRAIPLLVQVATKDPEKGIDSEGWFHTGDVGKIEGGFVYILDRLKD